MEWNELKKFSWFQPHLKRLEAEKFLKFEKVGGFCVRISESQPTGCALSVKCNDQIHHFKIRYEKNEKTYFVWNRKFTSIPDLVNHHRKDSILKNQIVILKDMGPEKVYGTAIHDFLPQEPDELGFKKGEIIEISDCSDEHWWYGTVNSCRHGLFPSKYVEKENK